MTTQELQKELDVVAERALTEMTELAYKSGTDWRIGIPMIVKTVSRLYKAAELTSSDMLKNYKDE